MLSIIKVKQHKEKEYRRLTWWIIKIIRSFRKIMIYISNNIKPK
jgi:hypothetical protein